ncbi:hypothetical protein A4S02_08515 [Acetobacter ascendens]|uniref:Uncharacterized protein n=1 Tax=Acetobacter ascendens TaxID=481146 RepID=A0A1D8QWT6_9PROT|nr:hypothetical protein A4S02_08515 [Acetobacter ascendens]
MGGLLCEFCNDFTLAHRDAVGSRPPHHRRNPAQQRAANHPANGHHGNIRCGKSHGHMLTFVEHGSAPAQCANGGGHKQQAANNPGKPALRVAEDDAERLEQVGSGKMAMVGGAIT